ncbi:hypothetical protein SPRG_19803 [Saprolegnia parasitica CBS 223.65]|uniref:Uncharacterized protein n=1 Tax=Saprolegnia parasitica (strain CBS 223.65) TaxID=695850 RepID=A0A067CUR3_SAPPC|nr:hypothetical protein SPRG_19803 [Saprolegnia parasitica CBS 223.65]KDO30251.1 hypothetical protein SPRG_19803 [Saprolegnia parasitica CBS 223.65]|eukprot:XP_012199056.1 hypothetical protein SPRG_19803 [Saprolegnia parasitica CBS 223.65]
MATIDELGDDASFSKSNWVATDAKARDGHLSLRYLNEFVGDLKCAPALLERGLFPDAKEVTETMGVFNAIRKLNLHVLDAGDDATGLRNGIVVVGDGMTPRTAAMFASRTKGWTCFSVDPIMRVSTPEAPVSWADMENVVPICAKIEDIRIRLNKAIVILVHAHVTMPQAMASIQANTVVAVLTLPCCNWYGHQEELDLRPPTVVYDDMSILSQHREIRLWLPDHTNPDAIVPVGGGCVRKAYVPPRRVPPPLDAFLHQMLSTPTNDLPSDIVAAVVDTCRRSLAPSAALLLLGDQPTVHAALQTSGFTNVLSRTELSASSSLKVDAILDVGYLHAVLSRVEKTKACGLVTELLRLYKSWLPVHSGDVLCLSGRRMLRSTKYFARPSLAWSMVVTPLAAANATFTTFLHHATVHDAPPVAMADGDALCSLEALRPRLDATFTARCPTALPVTSIADVLAGGDCPNVVVRTSGVVTRIHPMHAKLVLVDLCDAVDGKLVLVLLRQDSLMAPGDALRLPHTLLQHLQLGDTLDVVGDLEMTGTGSLSVKAAAVRLAATVSRDTLTYYQ